MRSIQEVFRHIQEKKAEQREINKFIREALASSSEYQDIKHKLEALRERRKVLEANARSPYEEKLDLIKLDLRDSYQNLSDIALNTMMKGERVEIMDTEKGKFEPVFSVRFKRAS
jgi:acetolactate synthase small subunit